MTDPPDPPLDSLLGARTDKRLRGAGVGRILQVLHLEDDPQDARLVQARLTHEEMNCNVIVVDSRDGFLRALEEKRDFDLILSDYALPSFNAMGALEIAKEKCPDIPFIVLSGTIGEEAAIEMLRGGATDYALKHRLQRLRPIIQRALQEAEDRKKRNEAETTLAERARLSGLAARIGNALIQEAPLKEILKRCAEAIASHLDAPLAAVWTLDRRTRKFQLMSSAGASVLSGGMKDDPPMDQARIEGIARDRQPYISANLASELNDGDPEWIKRDGITAFAAYPLTVGDEFIGMLAVYSRAPLTAFTHSEMGTIADSLALGIHRKWSEDRVRRQVSRLDALRAIDMVIMSSLDLKFTLNVILDHAVSQLRADAADILMFNQGTQSLDYICGRGFRTEAIARSHLRLGEGVAGRSAFLKKSIKIPDLFKAPEEVIRSSPLNKEEFKSYAVVPLVVKGVTKGVMEVFDRQPIEFDDDWMNLLETLGGQCAIAMDNAAMFEDLVHANSDLTLAYDATLEGWVQALDLRELDAAEHTRRVAQMSLKMAGVMGLSETERAHLRRGAILHDIGKLGIPDAILLKEGPLTEDEWKVMRKHPLYAHDWLHSIPFLLPALDIPFCHHEKWDGTGYPRGLKGEQIPLAARIFAIVDVWDALESDRPYRKSWPRDKIKEYVQSEIGKHFDPRVAREYLKLQR